MTKIVVVSGASFPLPSDWHAKRQQNRKRSPPDALRGARLKVGRAIQHIQTIDDLINRFNNSNVLLQEKELDGSEVFKLKIGPIPEMFPIVIGEALFQLRSSLDLLAASLPKAPGPIKGPIYFPIGSKKGKSAFENKLAKFSPPVKRFIRRFRPYEGGNKLLWALNCLRNQDAHVHLSIIELKHASWTGIVPVVIPWQESGPGFLVVEYHQTFETELIIARGTGGAQAYPGTKPEFSIAFDNMKSIKAQPVTTVLRLCADLVKGIIDTAETTFPP